MSSRTDEAVLEVIHTCRAMRRLEPRDVPDEEIDDLLDAAIRAPSGGNAQNWQFIVVRDPDVKRALGEEVRRGTRWKLAIDEIVLESHLQNGTLSEPESERNRRNARAFRALGDHYDEIPVLICVCVAPDTSTRRAAYSWRSVRTAVAEYGLIGSLRFAAAGRRLAEQAMWSAGYTAVQNILLAARAKGLGATLTAPHFLCPPGRIERILDLPREVKLCAVIPIGYPKGRFGPVRRRPLNEFIRDDRYTNRRADLVS